MGFLQVCLLGLRWPGALQRWGCEQLGAEGFELASARDDPAVLGAWKPSGRLASHPAQRNPAGLPAPAA
eukprot:6438989-Alexandrium_andersonii.AAC.1